MRQILAILRDLVMEQTNGYRMQRSHSLPWDKLQIIPGVRSGKQTKDNRKDYHVKENQIVWTNKENGSGQDIAKNAKLESKRNN
jgi:hypothetical protein